MTKNDTFVTDNYMHKHISRCRSIMHSVLPYALSTTIHYMCVFYIPIHVKVSVKNTIFLFDTGLATVLLKMPS